MGEAMRRARDSMCDGASDARGSWQSTSRHLKRKAPLVCHPDADFMTDTLGLVVGKLVPIGGLQAKL